MSTTTIPYPTLRKGAQGAAVGALHVLLDIADYTTQPPQQSINVFGEEYQTFGQITHNAVSNFQARTGLKVDGIVGVNTWAALEMKTPQQINQANTISEAIPSAPTQLAMIDSSIAGVPIKGLLAAGLLAVAGFMFMGPGAGRHARLTDDGDRAQRARRQRIRRLNAAQMASYRRKRR